MIDEYELNGRPLIEDHDLTGPATLPHSAGSSAATHPAPTIAGRAAPFFGAAPLDWPGRPLVDGAAGDRVRTRVDYRGHADLAGAEESCEGDEPSHGVGSHPQSEEHKSSMAGSFARGCVRR
jgi:hypothetical protein